MSYLAIARKYRPATFAEIVGQEHVTRTLTHAIERDRVHHAFLFCGARGVGKTTAARALAKSLNCAHGPTAEPCGECTSCREISAGTSPDLIEIDGASNNGVDDVRELRETVRYAPQQGRRKIYLIDEVHMLSNAAFNALLKTLEEPPPHVVFIFATTEPAKIPDTILSRVQRFDFKRIPAQGVVERLAEIAEREGATLSEAGLRMIARAGEGSMRDAQSLLDKVISFGGPEVTDQMVADTLGLIDRSLLHAMLSGLVQGQPDRCLDAIAKVYEFGHEMSQFTAELLEVIRNATFLRLSEQARQHVDLAQEEQDALLELVAEVEPATLSRTFESMMQTHEAVAHAARPRIVLEMAVARIATTRPVVPVGALVARLENLERRLRQAGGGASGGGGGGTRAAARRGGPGRASRAPTRTGARRRSRRTASSSLPDDASDDDRWAALQQELKALGGPAEALATGYPRRSRRDLVVTVGQGRPFAAASRAAEDPTVLREVRRCYGTGVTLRVEASQASGAGRDLEATVLSDPAVTRVLDVLGGTLESIESLSDPHAQEDTP